MRSCALLVVLGALAAACSSTESTASTGRRPSAPERARDPVGEAMPHEECVQGDDVVTQDANHDRQPDIRTMMEGGRPRCREVDANFDGRVDVYRWMDPATGQTTRVEDDYDFDGRIDVVATYEGGVVVRDILDTNFDGRTDTWRDYRGGQIAELRRDADGDGRVDTWERFDGEGRLTYSARDANHDGEPDADAAQVDAGTTAAQTPAAPAAQTPAAPAAQTPAAPSAPSPTSPHPKTAEAL